MDTHARALSLGLLSVGAMITSPARADCPELRWRDGLQIAIGFDQAPTAAASIDHDGDGVPTLFVAGEGAASGIGYAGLVRLVDGRWQPFGPSFTGTVQKFERFDFDGDGVPSFILLGSLQLEVGGPWYGMLEWSGSTWIPRSADRMIDDAVVLDDDGDGTPSLIASVPYPSPAGTSPLIRWTPGGWTALTPGYTVSYASILYGILIAAHDSDGDGSMELFASANVSQSGTPIATGMARWNGVSWTSASGAGTSGPIGSDPIASLRVADIDRNGSPELLALRAPLSGGGTTPQVAAYHGVSWSPVGGAFNSSPYRIEVVGFGALSEPTLVASGVFTQMGSTPLGGIARWNGVAWVGLDTGLGWGNSSANGGIVGHDVDGDGTSEIVAFGGFVQAGSVNVNRAGAFNGTAWSAIGTPAATLGLNWQAGSAVLFDHDGDGVDSLVVRGTFTMAGSVPASFLAAFDGSSWQPIAAPWPYGIAAMQVADLDGDGVSSLYAAGYPGWTASVVTVAAYTPSRKGGAWTQLGGAFNNQIEVISAADHDGDGQASLFVGGYFSQNGGAPIGKLARWTGSTWMGMNPGSGDWANSAVMFDDNGDGVPSLIVGLGRFDPWQFLQRVRKWTGSGWTNLGSLTNGHVWRLQLFDDDGDGVNSLFALGSIGGRVAARYQGGIWVPFGPQSSGPCSEMGAGLLWFDDDGDGSETLFLQTCDPYGSELCAALHRKAGASWEKVAEKLGTGSSDLAVVADLEGDGTRSLHFPTKRRAAAGGVGSNFGIIDPCVAPCPADLDGDGAVGVGDLVQALAGWGPCTAACAADLDGDGTVGARDLSAILSAWGGCP